MTPVPPMLLSALRRGRVRAAGVDRAVRGLGPADLVRCGAGDSASQEEALAVLGPDAPARSSAATSSAR